MIKITRKQTSVKEEPEKENILEVFPTFKSKLNPKLPSELAKHDALDKYTARNSMLYKLQKEDLVTLADLANWDEVGK